MPLAVTHRPDLHRFEATVDGRTCVADYRLDGDVLAVTHTGVPRPLEGRGIASDLMQALFEHAVAHRLKVAPLCSYAAAWLQRHPEFAGLRA